MRIPSNKIADIVSFFKQELSEIYENGELENVIWLSFHHVLGFSKSDMLLKKEERLNQSDLLKLNFICRELKKQKPIQYVLGETEFFGMKFLVNENVLIPRPETEELVHHVSDYLKMKSGTNIKVLDIGTGSGCIAVTLAKKFPKTNVFGLDVSVAAISVARENAELNEAKVTFIEDSILELKNANNLNSIDVIVSNPPYVTYEEKKSLHKSVIDFEPHLALFASKDDPLIFYRAIADFAGTHTNDTAAIFLEINPDFAREVKKLFEEKKFHSEILKDMFGKDRFVKAIK